MVNTTGLPRLVLVIVARRDGSQSLEWSVDWPHEKPYILRRNLYRKLDDDRSRSARPAVLAGGKS